MEVDRSAPVCESAEITVSTGPDTVWDTLTDLRSWPRWMRGVKQGALRQEAERRAGGAG